MSQRNFIAMTCELATESARGLAHSKTLRAAREHSEFAPASWSAATLRRFSIRAHSCNSRKGFFQSVSIRD
jgi:hypothetical protein